MGAPTIIASVLAQLQKFFNVQMPCFQVSTYSALAFAALIYRNGGIVDDFKKGHHALRFTIGALDVRAQRPHAGPVVAQATGKLGKQGVFLDRLVDAIQIVRHRGQVATREL